MERSNLMRSKTAISFKTEKPIYSNSIHNQIEVFNKISISYKFYVAEFFQNPFYKWLCNRRLKQRNQ